MNLYFAPRDRVNRGAGANNCKHDPQRVKANDRPRHRAVIPNLGKRREDESQTHQRAHKTDEDTDDFLHFLPLFILDSTRLGHICHAGSGGGSVLI